MMAIFSPNEAAETASHDQYSELRITVRDPPHYNQRGKSS